MSAIIFALISYLGWGIGDLFGAVAARKIGAHSNVFWSYLLSLVLFGILTPFFFGDLAGLTIPVFLLNVLLAVQVMIGLIAFYESLRAQNPSLSYSIAFSYPALTTILSVFFFRETLSPSQILSIIVIFSGLLLTITPIEDIKKGKFVFTKGAVFALGAFISFGIYFTFIKIPVQQIGWFWPNYFSFFLFPIVYLYMKFRKIKLRTPSYKNALLPVLLSIILLRVAEYSYNLAIGKGYVAIVSPIVGSSPTLFVLLSFFVFKEKITKQQVVGIVTTLVGIVLLSVFST